MPRAVTRAISSSFAGVPLSHSHGSSLDLSSAKASSIMDMYPSPRPSKASHSSSKASASSSSPSNRKTTTSSAPFTPPSNKSYKSGKRKRPDDASEPVKMPEDQIELFLKMYDATMLNRIHTARQALEMSLVSAKAQMNAGILAYPRSVLMARMEDFVNGAVGATKDNKASAVGSSIASAQPNKKPRIAKPGEVVYSARGSPILIQRMFGGGGSGGGGGEVIEGSSDNDDDEEDEPSFDTASDNSATSESFSLPDEVAYTRQIMEEQQQRKILSSEGYFPRSSSIFHRSSRSSST